MTTWQKIQLGLKFVFGSFESASDYLLKLLNDYLAKTNVAKKVEKAKAYVDSALEWAQKLQPYCPAKWASEYALLVETVRELSAALEDGQISGAELQAAVEGVKIAYDRWQKD